MTIDHLPPLARLAFYACILAGIAFADVLVDDWYGPFAVLVGFLVLVLPIFVRLFGHGLQGPIPKASGRAVIFFAAALTFLTVVETAFIPDYGLGATFWIVATLIPSFEFLGYFTRREARTQA
jgi:hypothetical protein